MLYVWVFAASVFVAGALMLVLLVLKAVRDMKTFAHRMAETTARLGEAAARIEPIQPRERS